MTDRKKIAVVLSGCGHLDGSETRETLFTLLSLDQCLADRASIEVFAPDKPQRDVVNHLNPKASNAAETRNILEESARLTRGQIKDLREVDANHFDGLILPGGFGAAKNLSSFAVDGPQAEVEPALKSLIEGLYERKKPIGAICIAPAILALVLGPRGIEITIGNDKATASTLEQLGVKHKNCAVDQICIDQNHKVITTPAYMYGDAPIRDVFRGIQSLVNAFAELV